MEVLVIHLVQHHLKEMIEVAVKEVMFLENQAVVVEVLIYLEMLEGMHFAYLKLVGNHIHAMHMVDNLAYLDLKEVLEVLEERS